MEPAADFGTSLKGDLRSTPFAHLLLDLMAEERFGTLLIHNEAGEIDARIRFEAGLPTGAHSHTIEQSVAQMLIPLCARTHGGFAFLEGKAELGYGAGVVIGRADPLAVIAASMRGPTREDAIDGVLGELADRPLEIDPEADLERLPFGTQEQRVLDLLRVDPLTLDELHGRLELSPHVVRRAVYLLSLSGAVRVAPVVRRSATVVQAPKLPPPPPLPRFAEVQQAQQQQPLIRPKKAASTLLEHRGVSGVVVRVEPVPGASAPSEVDGRYHVREPDHGSLQLEGTSEHDSLPPSQLPPALALWRREILERLSRIEQQQQNYFELLGVPATAREPEIDRAFGELYDRLQPDLLPDALASLRDAAETVLQHLIEAHETLRDPKRRSEYVVGLRAGKRSVVPHVSATAAAEVYRQKAEGLLRRKDYAGALQEAERAFRLEHSAANEAFYGWLLYLRHSAGGRIHPAARKHLQRAALRDPRCEQAQFYTGCLLKQFGRSEEADLHFRRVLKINPDHQEAAREVRLYEVRNRKDSGVIDRLLKRGKQQR